MSNVAKTTMGLMIVTLLSKVLGFGRELVLASSYGASLYSDAYLVALNIPNVIFAAIATALATTFIPIYYEANRDGIAGKGINFTNDVINLIVILGAGISILCFIFVEPLVKLFAIGFEGEILKITIKFTKILILGITFIALAEIMKAYLNANNNFSIPAVMFGIPFNLIIILSIFISKKLGPHILPIGTLIAILSRVILQYPYMKKYGYKYEVRLKVENNYIEKMFCLLIPVLIGVGANQINSMIDRTLASTLQEGSISALNYASKLNGFVLGLFIASIAAVIYPILSKLSSDDDKEKFVNTVVKSINSVMILIIPISAGAMILATPIVKVLFQRGAFDAKATEMTSTALVFYSIGLIAFGLTDVLRRVFYSLQDTKTPMINGVLAVLLNIVLNVILIKYMGHAGLAFSTSISAVVSMFLLFTSLQKKIGYFGQDKIIKTTFKSFIATIIMGGVTKIVYKLLIDILGIGFIGEVTSLFGAILLGVIVYGVIVMILKVEEINVLIDRVKKIIK